MTFQNTSLSGKAVLVTGAKGFVGKSLTAALASAGASVAQFEGDVSLATKDAVGQQDIVFHLAAFTNLAASAEDPVRAFEVNALGTMRLLTACAQVKKFVYVSTLGVYGEPQYLPVDERHPTMPVEPYAASKLAGEAAVRGFCTSRGMSFAIARLFNVYGPGQRDDFVVARLMNEILHNSEVTVRNPQSTRDFIHVTDVAEGIIAAGLRGENDVYNIGTGIETSIQDLATLIAQVAKRPVSLTMQSEVSAKGVRRSQADTRHTQKSIGWSARIALAEGLKTLVP